MRKMGRTPAEQNNADDKPKSTGKSKKHSCQSEVVSQKEWNVYDERANKYMTQKTTTE